MIICACCRRPDCCLMTDLKHYAEDSIKAEYYRRLRLKKAASVAEGGKTGGWPKGKPRKTVIQSAL